MEILSFTNPSSSSHLVRVARPIPVRARMVPALPYDYSYLDEDADDERVEGVIRKAVGFIRLVGYEQTGGREEKYHESEDEGRSWICFEVAFQSLEVRWPSLFPVRL